MALRGRLGGLTTAATHDGRELTERARSTYRASFRDGHRCKLCPPVIIPADLPELERARRGELLRRLHFARLGSHAARKRGAA